MIFRTLVIAVTWLSLSLPAAGGEIIAVRVISIDYQTGRLKGRLIEDNASSEMREAEGLPISVKLKNNAFVPGYTRPGRLIWLRGEFSENDRYSFTSGDILGCGLKGCDRTGVRNRIGAACRRGSFDPEREAARPGCRCGNKCRCNLPDRTAEGGPR